MRELSGIIARFLPGVSLTLLNGKKKKKKSAFFIAFHSSGAWQIVSGFSSKRPLSII